MSDWWDAEETDYQPKLGDSVIALMCPEAGPGKVIEVLACDGAKVEWPDGSTGSFVSERLELHSGGEKS